MLGIHGRPYAPWNGFNNVPGAPRFGYCPHCTWHHSCRLKVDQETTAHPLQHHHYSRRGTDHILHWLRYVLHEFIIIIRQDWRILQQVLATHIQALAKEYPASQQATYQAAADTFRLPYWDWGSQPDLPPIATAQSVQVISPSGPITIRNPLYSYRFPQLDSNLYPRNQDSGLSTYPETVRQAVSTVNSRLRAEDLQRRTVGV